MRNKKAPLLFGCEALIPCIGIKASLRRPHSNCCTISCNHGQNLITSCKPWSIRDMVL